ncbi:MAG: hypothetical protein ACR2JC_17275 [Chloroflexota bacterium]
MHRLFALLAISLLLSACGSKTSGARAAPTLGSSHKAIDAAWNAGNGSAECKQENLAVSCTYVYRGIHVVVTYDQRHFAEQFQTDGSRHRGIDIWTFLNGLVPHASRRLSCRYVPHSTGGGTAHACLYRQKKRDMIVAYFLHPADEDYGGLVTYDFEEYKDIQAGDNA